MKSELLAFAKPACVLLCAGLALAACVAPPPPPAPTFKYDPPAATTTKQNVSVAILKPVPSGKFVVRPAAQQSAYAARETAVQAGRLNLYSQEMFAAAQNDVEKMLTAKGFSTNGRYSNFEEMTFSQKEKSTVILNMAFNVEVDPVKGTGLTEEVQTRGQITLELLEPMSREKVWLKKINLPPFPSKLVVTFSNDMKYVSGAFPEDSYIKLLSEFYRLGMPMVWDALDTRELLTLKKDADTLKNKTQYSGGRR